MRFFPAALSVLLSIAVMSLAGCAKQSTLEKIESRGELRVLTLPGPSTYFIGAHGASGLDYELSAKLAAELGVKLTMIPLERQADIWRELSTGRGDIAAAHLPHPRSPSTEHRFSAPMMYSQSVLVYRAGTPAPSSLKDLSSEEIVVTDGSSAVTALFHARTLNPTLKWKVVPAELDDLLESISNEELSFTVADEDLIYARLPMYPDIRIGIAVGVPQPIVWAFAKLGDDHSLSDASARFLARSLLSGELQSLTERYRRQDREQDVVQDYFFLRHFEERLPRYRGQFESAASEFKLDWRVIAAVGYQESHWNPTARSPTGVRGLMMLTQDTANRLGVKDRLDAAQSIQGGAKYLREMLDQVPDRIQMPDRLNFALAAYNIGIGHLEDARVLTEARGGDPDHWPDVRATLPLLSRAIWHQKTRLGRAPGGQAVEFVQSVGDYLARLEWQTSNALFAEEFARKDAVSRRPAAAVTAP